MLNKKRKQVSSSNLHDFSGNSLSSSIEVPSKLQKPVSEKYHKCHFCLKKCFKGGCVICPLSENHAFCKDCVNTSYVRI